MPEGGSVQSAVAAVEQPVGDQALLEKAFLEHQGRVFRAAYRITGNAQDAEDVLQTVFLRLARQGGSIAMNNPPSYLYRAAVNSALDLLRSRRDHRTVPIEEASSAPDGATAAPDRRHEGAEVRRRLRQALAALPPRAAEIFALRYLEGEANRDIARMLGVTRITVAVTLHRARKKLQDDLRILRGSR
ncbi:MAG TPA: RNA polymerase sigma factor [Vicinamibacteria bacterium]|nr:RNA polymerase sigma factor [Vicinamibacteria bacterium]